jgi:hypothetical protein
MMASPPFFAWIIAFLCTFLLTITGHYGGIKGSLKGLQGELVEIGGHSQVMIRIDHLGYAIVEMPVGYVKKV